jgi:hypothetical protein
VKRSEAVMGPDPGDSALPAEPTAFCENRGLYREIIELAKSLGYADWDVLEAVDCSGLAKSRRVFTYVPGSGRTKARLHLRPDFAMRGLSLSAVRGAVIASSGNTMD